MVTCVPGRHRPLIASWRLSQLVTVMLVYVGCDMAWTWHKNSAEGQEFLSEVSKETSIVEHYLLTMVGISSLHTHQFTHHNSPSTIHPEECAHCN
jgi:hypothetical protein